jgi:GAF domain-containing protein
MSDAERFVNTYRNARTQPKPTERPELVAFYNEADRVLGLAAELTRVVAPSHQAAATLVVDGDWTQARKYFSLSEKYAAWAEYGAPAVGVGIHAYIIETNRPVRLTQQELEAHPAWRNFGTEYGKHPPMRGLLAMPLIGSDGLNYGLLQASDRYDGDYTEVDEAQLRRLAALTSTALDALARTHFPDYREKVEKLQNPGQQLV